MISIKKNLLVFLVIIALIAGASGMAMYMGIDISNLAGFSGNEGNVTISASDYEEYQYFKKTYDKVDSLRTYIAENYYKEVNQEDLDTGILKGLFEGLGDYYSYYMTAEEYESILISLTGEYSGVGITLSPNDDGYIEVIAPTEGSPAEDAGIKRGDIVLSVDGVEYIGAEIDTAAAAIRGKAGTRVNLVILRDGAELEFNLRREKIVSKTVKSEILADNIGYIRISAFEESTYEDFKAALYDMEAKVVDGLVIDLRDNPGGLVDSCIEIADLLMDKGTVVYSENQSGEREYYTTKDGATDIPFVLLVNGGSASASEILSAGIQDNDAGEIVGTQTYGKGVIQQMDQLTDGSAVKLTILQYYSPNGNVIHEIGITPDYVVELLDKDYDAQGEIIVDRQLNKALELLK